MDGSLARHVNRERAHLRRADAQRADQQGSKAVRSPPRVSVEREFTGRGPSTYPPALFRFAQDVFNLFDIAFLAAALHGFRVRFVLG